MEWDQEGAIKIPWLLEFLTLHWQFSGCSYLGFVYPDTPHPHTFSGALKTRIYYFANNLAATSSSIYNVSVLESMWVLIIAVYCARLCTGLCLWASAGALPEMKREGEVQPPHRCSSCLCCSEVGLKQQDAVLHWAGWDSVSKPGAAARQQGQDLEQEATNPRWLWVSAGFPREYHSSPMTKHSQVTNDGVVLTPLFLW
jgi:hypothetical protein